MNNEECLAFHHASRLLTGIVGQGQAHFEENR